MARIAYFVHGRGSGHAARARAIIARLRAHGHVVEACAGGDALKLLPDEEALRTIVPMLPGWAGSKIALQRLRSDHLFLRHSNVDLVITDGDAPGLHAARLLDLPSIAIGHGLLFNNAALGPLPWQARLYERFNAASSCWIAQRKIAVHFLHAASTDAKTVVARPDLTHLDALPVPADRPYLLAYFRDHNGAQAIRGALDLGFHVVNFGGPNDTPAGALSQPFSRHDFARALRGCMGVLGSAGSNLLAECVALGKPVFALYRRGDHEQHMNAILLERAQVGMSARLDLVTHEKLATFAARLLVGDFVRYPLQHMLPCVTQCVVQACDDLIGAPTWPAMVSHVG